MRKAQGRLLFATVNGYIGYGPETLMEGDVVAVLYRQMTPLILRPTGTGSYNLVGDAYVDGIMHGEIVASSLDIEDFTLT